MITYEIIKENEDIKTYIECADSSLKALGYTEHSYAHVGRVASTAKYILETLDYPSHEIELAQIAAHLHDIGKIGVHLISTFILMVNTTISDGQIAELIRSLFLYDTSTNQ